MPSLRLAETGGTAIKRHNRVVDVQLSFEHDAGYTSAPEVSGLRPQAEALPGQPPP